MISRSAQYAVGAMVALAESDGDRWIQSQDLAERTGLRHQYLNKILRRLAVRGLLHSRRGRAGGFRLARAAGEVTLFEVVDSIDGLDGVVVCLLRPGACDAASPCGLHTAHRRIHQEMIMLLRSTTLADSVGKVRQAGRA